MEENNEQITPIQQNSQNKTVLIAEKSGLLGKVISIALKHAGFEVEIVKDGYEVLHKVMNKNICCLILDRYLPSIEGYKLAAIIRDGMNLSSLPIIIISAEEEADSFWDDTSNVTEVFALSSGNVSNLVKRVQEYTQDFIVEKKFITQNINQSQNQNSEKPTELEEKVSEFADNHDELEDVISKNPDKKYTLFAVNAMEKSYFYYNMMRQIFELNRHSSDLDEFIESAFKLLLKICDFDAVAIIIHDSTSLIYTAGIENKNPQIQQDFINICKTDYEKNENVQGVIEYSHLNMDWILPHENQNPEEQNQEYASYIVHNIDTVDFLGTIHIASNKMKFFNEKTSSAVQFFAEKTSFMLMQTIIHRRVTLSEQRLRFTFSKFVPEEIIEDLLNNYDSPSENPNNEKRRIAVMICDIRSFTTISEINQPENVVSFLNGYFTRMVDIIRRHGGAIDKFIGDAIMALFGAPISYVDNAKRAVDAALEMNRTLEEIDTSLLTFPEGMKLDIGIGIHQGEMIVGNIGCNDKTDYTVIGDSVNLTSRIEGLTKTYGARTMVSQAIYDDLSDDVNCLLLDKVRVKGKNLGVQVYRVDEKPLDKEFIKNYEKGLSLYLNGAWTLALDYFKNANQIVPTDKASRLMIERCQEFIKNPPSDWNGAIALTSK